MASLAITLGITVGASLAQGLLFKPKKQHQKQDKNYFPDISIQGSDYGAFIPKIKGKCRVAPQVVFSNGIQHYVRTTTNGGGGGGGKGGAGGGGGGNSSNQTVNEHIYQTTVGLLVCSNQVQAIKRIWANTTEIFSVGATYDSRYEAEEAVLSGGAVTVEDGTASNGYYVTGINSGGGQISFNFHLNLSRLPDDPDPDEFTIRTQITVYYRASAERSAQISFNGEPFATHVFPAAGGETGVYVVDELGAIPEMTIANPSGIGPDIDYVEVFYYRDTVRRPIPKVTGIVNPDLDYPADLDDPSAYYNYTPPVSNATGAANANTPIPTQSIRYYTGTETQTADSAIIAWLDATYGTGEGIKRASAMRGMTYVVIENYTIEGGALPNFTIEVDEGSRALRDYVEFLYEIEGIDGSELELEALTGLRLEGFIINQFTPAAQTIRQLEIWFGFKMVEIDGIYRAVLEYDAIVGTVPAIDLRAHGIDEEMPETDCEIVNRDEQGAPRVSIVNFLNPELLYHNEAAEDMLYGSTAASEIKEQNFPFVSDPDTARKVASKELVKDHFDLQTFPFDAMPKYARYAPGDRITLELDTREYDVRIVKKAMALPGKARFEAVRSDAEVYGNEAVKSAPPQNYSVLSEQQAAPNFPRNSKLLIFESVSLLTEQRKELGFYMAVSGRGLGRWNGAQIHKQTAPDMFEPISVVTAPSPIGVMQNSLGNWADPSEVDTDSTCIIYFYDKVELESIEQADAWANPSMNLIRVGLEWLQFTHVLPMDLPIGSKFGSAFELTFLIRGRFGTRNRIATHTASEFACVATSALKWRRFEPAELDTELLFKAVTNGQSPELAAIEGITPSGESVKDVAVTDESYEISLFESKLTFSNAGTDVDAVFTLPAAKRGFYVSFSARMAEKALNVEAQTGEPILFGTQSAAAISSETPGSFVTLRGDDTYWIAEDITGKWNVTETE